MQHYKSLSLSVIALSWLTNRHTHTPTALSCYIIPFASWDEN